MVRLILLLVTMLSTFSMVASCQSADMLIDDYRLEISEGGCDCSPWYSATARLSEDIGQALPYLASVITDVKYEPDRESLCLIKDRRYIYIYPKRIDIPYIKSSDEAHVLVEWVKDVLNEAYLGYTEDME